ncbi:hypothetical protein D5F01_LYC25246 [Larimichthys crocea]|uniref:Uncharacterized protein n=1 Tax=Larimichthys crocea TaxID=215358 RepID=A0A6G0HCP8_LARCR|nr:hypothetical protein D5F01_LYC25246 [Larimichthys crocea]
MAHVPPSSLHTSLGNLGSTEPLSSWRSEGPDHTHTTHARTHKHTQRNQEEGPDMAHVPPSSLHTSLGNLGSTEPLSSWRSEGPDHTHTTHARTTSIHRGTRRRALTWLTSHPAACTHPWATWAPQSLSPPGGQRGLIILTLHTHARTSIHRGTRRRALTWLTSHPAACTHPWANLGSTEPLSSWRSEGPDHTHTTRTHAHKHTQRNQEEGPDMAHVPPSSLHTSLGNLGSTEPLSSWRSEVRGA